MNDLRFLYLFLLVPLRATWKVILVMLCLLALVGSLFYAMTIDLVLDNPLFNATPEPIAQITKWQPKDNTIIFDKDGNVISEQFNEYHVYIPFEKIPQEMINAIVAIEDRKFWKHQGIDIYGIVRAASHLIRNQKGRYTQGASTITQQVVKNLLLTKEKTITRKLREIVLSLYLESYLTKEKIMEIYCNQIFLGHGSYGVGAAARRYFGKEVSELKTHQFALIAGLFQLPGRYNPQKYPKRAKQRQETVLKAMKSSGYLTDQHYALALNAPMEYEEYQSRTKLAAPYFVDYTIEQAQEILSEKGIQLKDSGLKIYTTLDTQLQTMAENSIAESESIYKMMKAHLIKDNKILNQQRREILEIDKAEGKINDVEASLLAFDRKTGKIVAMVGGRDYDTSQFNRTTKALRAPGSVFKSFTYSYGLKQGKNWNDMYYISPITIGNYRPRTEQAKLFSETTLLEAFYKSVNSPAVTLGTELGVLNVINHAKRLGVETELKDEAATLLGSSEVTIMDMAKAYSTLANYGNKITPVAITKITNKEGIIIYEAPSLQERSKQVLDVKSAELIVQGLKEVLRRGTGYKISYLSGYAAGKTGTSNKSKDNWFCGFTNDLVVVAWLGNDDQNSFSGAVSASNTAAPLWGKFVSKTFKKLNTARLSAPRYLRAARINKQYGHRDANGITMYFLAGKVPEKKESDLMRINNGEKIRIGLNDF